MSGGENLRPFTVRAELVEAPFSQGEEGRPFDRLRANGERTSPGASAFSGYAALWDRVDRAGDVFRRGAFAGATQVPLLRGHGGPPLGAVVVREDARGLLVEGAASGVRVGDGLSVGFRPVRARQGVWRELLAVELIEVSLVAVPMQPLARVETIN